jgi:putative peptidoglycan lipid II flippase
MGALVASFSRVSLFTLLSRILGLLRDILMFAGLGSGVASSAFIFAFTLPNLFRRLLGEGALMSSAIPVFAEVDSQKGRPAAFFLLNGILTRLLLAVSALTVMVWVGLGIAGQISGLEERWYLGFRLSTLLFPYVILICLSAIVCGMLQVMHRFSQPALTQVWLNLSMIAALLAGVMYIGEGATARVWLLSISVVFGGFLQLIIPAWDLWRNDWKPQWALAKDPYVDKVMRLFLPGLLGAAIFQINVFVSRVLAFSLDDMAAGLLYIASRLVELPLGLFAIAISTVVFPQLARDAASGNTGKFLDLYRHGLRMVFVVTLPAAVGLVVLAGPILVLLFEWGRFDANDVRNATPVVMAAAAGIPFFAWSTYLTRGFYAFQDMRTPVRFAAINLVVNLVLSIAGMLLLGAMGLALANSISSLIHCLLLNRSFFRLHLPGCERPRILSLPLVGALVMMGGFSALGWYGLTLLPIADKQLAIFGLMPLIGLSALIYLGFLAILRSHEWNVMREWWMARRLRNPASRH